MSIIEIIGGIIIGILVLCKIALIIKFFLTFVDDED